MRSCHQDHICKNLTCSFRSRSWTLSTQVGTARIILKCCLQAATMIQTIPVHCISLFYEYFLQVFPCRFSLAGEFIINVEIGEFRHCFAQQRLRLINSVTILLYQIYYQVWHFLKTFVYFYFTLSKNNAASRKFNFSNRQSRNFTKR